MKTIEQYEQISFLLNQKSKVEKSIERLKVFEPPEGYYLAFSGGKDSIVIYHLAKMAGVKFDSHYSVTGIDHPGLIYNMKKNYSDVIFDYPQDSEGKNITMWNLIPRKLMPPTRIVRYCCDGLKERGGKGRFVITGVRWAESTKRKNRGTIENFHKNKKYQFKTDDNEQGRMQIENCLKKGKFILNAIIDWEDKDVWEFIHKYNLKYPQLYDQGYKRLGCIGCPMGSCRRKELEQYPKIRKLYIKAFSEMLKEREKAGKETEWKTAEDVMEWWLDPPQKDKKLIENQVGMI